MVSKPRAKPALAEPLGEQRGVHGVAGVQARPPPRHVLRRRQGEAAVSEARAAHLGLEGKIRTVGAKFGPTSGF